MDPITDAALVALFFAVFLAVVALGWAFSWVARR